MARMRTLVIALVLGLLPLSALSPQQKYWQSYLEVAGRTTSYRKGTGTYLFMPVAQDPCSLVFSQFLGGHFIDSWVGSAGIGYRRLQRHNLAWGVNAFFDLSRTDNHQTFYQGGVGAELLGCWWEARVNGYFPNLKRKIVKEEAVTEFSMSGSTVIQTDFTRRTQEAGYRGVDGEIGAGCNVPCGSVWAYAGYYHFSTNKQTSFYGPRLRLEYRLDNVFGWCGVQATVGGEYEYDKIHGNRTSLLLSFRVPLGCYAQSDCCSPSSIYRRMGNRVRRIESIVVAEQVKKINPTSQAVPSPFGLPMQVFMIDSAAALDNALAASNPYDTFVLTHSFAANAPVILQDNQVFLGFGEAPTLSLMGGDLILTSENGRALLYGDLTVANANHLEGFGLEGTILGTNPVGTTIRDVTIAGSLGDGIALIGSQNTTIENVTIRDVGGHGISLNTHNTHLSNISIDRTGGAGIVLANADHVTMHNVIINGSEDRGLRIQDSHNITLDNLRLTGNGATITATSDLFATDLSIHSRKDGLTIERSLGPIEFANATITAGEAGLLLHDNVGTINFGRLEVISQGDSLVANNQIGLLTAHNGTIISNGGAAINLTSATVDLAALTLIARNTPSHGINLEAVSGKLDIRGAALTDCGIRIKGGAPIFSYTGSISHIGRILSVENVLGGSISLKGTEAGLNGQDAYMANSNCEVSLSSAHLIDPVVLENNTGSFTIRNSQPLGGITTNTIANLTVQNCTFSGMTTAINLHNVQGIAAISSNTFSNLAGHGTAVALSGSTDTSLRFSGNKVIGATLGQEVSIQNALTIDTSGAFHLIAENNDIVALHGHAIVANTSGSAKFDIVGNRVGHTGDNAFHIESNGPQTDLHIVANTFNDNTKSGIVLEMISPRVDGLIAGNTFDQVGTNSTHGAIIVAHNQKNADDTMNITIADNHTITGKNSIAIAAESLKGSNGLFNIQLIGNKDTNQRIGLPAYQIGNNGSGSLIFSAQRNSSERIPPSLLITNRGEGTITVDDLEHIDEHNNQIGVKTYGDLKSLDK